MQKWWKPSQIMINNKNRDNIDLIMNMILPKGTFNLNKIRLQTAKTARIHPTLSKEGESWSWNISNKKPTNIKLDVKSLNNDKSMYFFGSNFDKKCFYRDYIRISRQALTAIICQIAGLGRAWTGQKFKPHWCMLNGQVDELDWEMR